MRIFSFLISVLFFCNTNLSGQQTIGLFINDSLSMNGYTLWSPNNSTYLIDNCGHLINKWDSARRAGLSVYLLENGNLLRTSQIGGDLNGAGSGGRIEEYDWDNNILWSYDISDSNFQQHHDIEPLPNGNILVIAWELKSRTEAFEAGASSERVYWSEAIFELEKNGTQNAAVVWEWHMWDHLVQDIDSSRPNYGVVKDHPELLNINYKLPSGGGFGGAGDWLHFNAVDYDPLRDEILMSSRTHDEVYVIDHSTTTEEAASHSGGNHDKGGDILYRWGNPEVYDRGTSVHKKLFGQHDIQVIPEGFPGEGNYTIFNNGSGRPAGAFSSIEEIKPPRDPDGRYIINDNEFYGPELATWQHIEEPPTSFYSNNMAGAHRLKNGNTLICEANAGTYFEVTPEGQTVWLYQNTLGANGPLTQGSSQSFFGSMTFRVSRYAEDYPGFEDKDMTPGELIEINPIPSDCQIYINPSTSTIDLDNQKQIDVTTDISLDYIGIHNHNKDFISIHLLDLNGRLLSEKQSDSSSMNLDISDLQSGLYILTIIDHDTGAYQSSKFVKI